MADDARFRDQFTRVAIGTVIELSGGDAVVKSDG